jgi:hypothetical protein
MQFYEMFHPDTGLPYGGMQEAGVERGIKEWRAAPRQTWAATAYLRMIFFGVAGMRFDVDGLRLEPCVPTGLTPLILRNIRYRDMTVDITLKGVGTSIVSSAVNGEPCQRIKLNAQDTGSKSIVVTLAAE